ncbi:unnamed protein product [Vicia faba]|uniref:B3 domain-containing protein n=1 Tax=Vicia faba TaxID=3906 RepID=A0AAV0ZYN0_VICFA|nr:unnamed protein product [Vicia faba]CAI8601948.1 unnamed protein product [Vicia faba]
MAPFKLHLSSSNHSSSTTTDDADHLTLKWKRPQQDLSSYPNETNVCLHLSLGFCNCIQIAERESNVGTSSDSSTSRDDPWKIKKVLTASDLGNNSRLLLNKELAKKWVVPFVDKAEAENDGVKVPVFDVDTQTLRSLVFKIWSSNGSHVFNDTWIKDFVKIRNLKAGDEIGLKWDQNENKFDFSVLRRA